jgi:hypothetical protein
MTVLELYQEILGLTPTELRELRRLLGDLGDGRGGVREIARPPRQPLDAQGIALDAEMGKADRRA